MDKLELELKERLILSMQQFVLLPSWYYFLMTSSYEKKFIFFAESVAWVSETIADES